MAMESNKVMELPILKHFDQNQISLNPKNWRKGEKGIATIIGLVLLCTARLGIVCIYTARCVHLGRTGTRRYCGCCAGDRFLPHVARDRESAQKSSAQYAQAADQT